MPIGARRVFTELVEVAQTELVREAASGVEAKYQGAINQAYLNDMFSQLPEKYIRKEGFINTMAAYTAGTITVATGSTTVIGASTSWTSGLSDAYLNVSGYNRLNRVTYTAGTALTFKNSLTWTESSGSGKSYTLLQDRYQLASDFSYLSTDNPENPNSVFYYVNGYRVQLSPVTNQEYDRIVVPTTSAFFSQYTQKWESGNPYLYIYPFPLNVDIIGYQYMPVLTAMSEYTTGTITLTTGTAVVGSSTLFSSLDSTDTWYLRNDADGTGSASLWYQVSSFSGNSAATLSSAFAGTSGAGITYTICNASKWPARFDDTMLYKACLVMDPDNVQSPKWTSLYTESLNTDRMVEAKRKRDTQLKSFFGMRR